MTATNNIPPALKERTKLIHQIEHARQRRTDLSRSKLATENRIRELETKRLDAYTRKARGVRTAQKDAERIEAEINEARRSIESIDAEIEGALRAERQTDEELTHLLASKLSTFVEEAEKVTQETIEAATEFEAAYRRIYGLWQQSAEIWGPLRAATYQMHKMTNEQAGFHLPDTELMNASIVPPFPLQPPDEVFPLNRSPRPPAFEPPDDEDDDE
jgi:predicted  nucleic acid-binding Zn-ribbon protein